MMDQDLLDPERLLQVVIQNRPALLGPPFPSAAQRQPDQSVSVSGLHCSICNRFERVYLRLFRSAHLNGLSIPSTTESLRNTLFGVRCVNCHTDGFLLVFDGPDGLEVVGHGKNFQGIVAKGTPESVVYYLRQAYRCRAAGANSAAVVMFRAALEHLLTEREFEVGKRLGTRVDTLKMQVEDDKAPRWARDIEMQALPVLVKLGNYAIHANDGDVSRQNALDGQLLQSVNVVFNRLLEVVYEAPLKAKEHQERMAEALSKMQK